MARESRRSNERYKYGKCLNEECPKCVGKEIIQVPMRKEFVCPECGKELRECPPPPPPKKILIIVGAVAVAALLGVGGYFLFSGDSAKDRREERRKERKEQREKEEREREAEENSKGKTVIVHDTLTQVVRDTLTEVVHDTLTQVVHDTKVVEKIVEKPVVVEKIVSTGSGTVNLSYGKYTGATKKGYPHGQGRLTYSTARQINRNDMKGSMASAGDYVIGEFHNGFVVYGTLYDASGNVKEKLTFGVGPEDSYDSK